MDILTLSYRLVGVDGFNYAAMSESRDNPPTFVVFKGDKQVGYGTFEYG